jgi:cyclopropane fatty-acyl-phospholipid synthase-like methyltransferase
VGRDRWAEWLAVRRFGDDPATRERFLGNLAATRDKVLDRVGLREGETLLDVGCGEGLIAFGALERGAGEVVFSDISAHLLDLCREAADELGVLDRCRFVEAPADDLPVIEDGVDAAAGVGGLPEQLRQPEHPDARRSDGASAHGG